MCVCRGGGGGGGCGTEAVLLEIVILSNSKGQLLSITFIFVSCHRSSAAVTPVKYERDIIRVTSILLILKIWENNA